MCHYKSRDRVIVDLSGAGVFYSRDSVKHREAVDRKGGLRGALATYRAKIKKCMSLILIRITEMHWTQWVIGNAFTLFQHQIVFSKKIPL